MKPPIQSQPPVYIVDKAPPPPSAPPYYPPQYTYAVPYQQQQQQTYAVPYQQQQTYAYYQRPSIVQPQQQQPGVGTAMLGGFVLGAVMEDILDPTE